MATVEVTISGLLYDKLNRTTQNVVLIGEAMLTGLGVGGGPIYPPPGGGQPPVSPGHPAFPIVIPPGSGWLPGGPSAPGGYPPSIQHPIVIPPDVPPGMQPPTPPTPGDPTTVVPPPAGSPGWPVQPIAVPPYIVVNYPGVGPVIVAPPATSATTPPAT